MKKSPLDNSFNKLYDGLSKSELLEILKYEIKLYRNEAEISVDDSYDEGFLDAMRWVHRLLAPGEEI